MAGMTHCHHRGKTRNWVLEKQSGKTFIYYWQFECFWIHWFPRFRRLCTDTLFSTTVYCLWSWEVLNLLTCVCCDYKCGAMFAWRWSKKKKRNKLKFHFFFNLHLCCVTGSHSSHSFNALVFLKCIFFCETGSVREFQWKSWMQKKYIFNVMFLI